MSLALRKYFLLLTLVLTIVEVSPAQDVHFSQFNSIPAEINPALSSLINGDMRLVSCYRNQWYKLGFPIQTYFASGDFILTKDYEKYRDLFFFGANAYGDKSGNTGVSNTGISIPFGYARDFSYANDIIVSAAMQIGYHQFNFDPTKLVFGSQYINEVYNPNNPTGEYFPTDQANYFDVGGGLNYYFSNNWNYTYSLGISAFHLNRPELNFTNLASNYVNRRYNFHANASFRFLEDLEIVPGALYMMQGPDKQLTAGAYLKYRYAGRLGFKEYAYLGVFSRALSNDALIIIVRADYNQFNIGLSYDINLSPLKAYTNYFGAAEISITYNIFNPKQRRRMRKYGCPVF